MGRDTSSTSYAIASPLSPQVLPGYGNDIKLLSYLLVIASNREKRDLQVIFSITVKWNYIVDKHSW